MEKLPKQFQEEIERAARRQKASARHFCALAKTDDDALRQWINEKSLDEPEKEREKERARTR